MAEKRRKQRNDLINKCKRPRCFKQEVQASLWPPALLYFKSNIISSHRIKFTFDNTLQELILLKFTFYNSVPVCTI